MTRRIEPITTLTCSDPTCTERVHYRYSTLTEQREAARMRRGESWYCSRHTQPDAVLSLTNRERELVLTAMPGEGQYIADKLFWAKEGGKPSSGFEFGPGFKAWANDFPRGTKLIVTARIEAPEKDLVDQAITEYLDDQPVADGGSDPWPF